jgi:4a-hydroxytetrahydrobiopterin dehydratase
MARATPLLSDAELSAFLASHPDWRRVGQELRRTYELPSFLAGIAFVQRVAEVAEREDHHPDIDIRWRKVTLALTTHDAGGLTARDPRVAAEADRLFTEVTQAG